MDLKGKGHLNASEQPTEGGLPQEHDHPRPKDLEAQDLHNARGILFPPTLVKIVPGPPNPDL